jgi:hypothetical protein
MSIDEDIKHCEALKKSLELLKDFETAKDGDEPKSFVVDITIVNGDRQKIVSFDENTYEVLVVMILNDIRTHLKQEASAFKEKLLLNE